ncbi:hypothetical protein K1T71_011253 [Dendrolimus kikuchii]|uniref:Uncharacterized protein n=1 Tax=Dendrolimus kikuchii TaxID=765133 RepID=A0ACC1CNL7_9NEOP|nr:hypothetical protein K1T71_011253 [Dendrolimus kikuchii]
MATLELEGKTLGDKHRYYNKLLKEALTNGSSENITVDYTGDIKNLLDIDLANCNKNVEAILKAFQSTDSLYWSHAIKRCVWLIKDESYAHIINPEYVYNELLPFMTKQAFNKLMLRIRLTLKDETRVEEFYRYIKERDEETAFKWLQHCSLPFVTNVVEESGNEIPKYILERLFRRSFTIFETYIKENDDTWRVMQNSKFLLNFDTEKYLNIVKSQSNFSRPRFTAKNTKLIMKRSPHIILKDFEFFSNQIHWPTLAKYIKSEDVPHFLTNYVKISQYSITYHHLKYFVRHMPNENKFQSIKAVFIDKNDNTDSNNEHNLNVFWPKEIKDSYSDTDTYQWYLFAPFKVAFYDLTKLIKAESSPGDRNKILTVLIGCAKADPGNIKMLLQYYKEKHINEPFNFKAQFIDTLLKKTKAHRYNEETWKVLNQLFFSMEVYGESTRYVQKYIEHIIIYNSIHKIENPKIIERKFKFNTLKLHQHNLNSFEKDIVFEYLCGYLTKKLENQKTLYESDFKATLALLENLFSLLNDWDKELKEYPKVLNKLKELLVIKDKNRWNDNDLAVFYNCNKSWKRSMFEESIILYPSDEVCVNALKHDPDLLKRHQLRVDELRCDDTLTTRRVLNKLRIYWPHTIAVEWTEGYLKQFHHDPKTNLSSVVKGLMALLETEKILPIIKRFAPDDTKIKWDEDNLLLLSIRKHIAKNLHLARPPLAIDDILLYAKGDYVQYTVSSLVSTIYNLNRAQSKKDIMKLIHGPVSLQKFGIRLALLKINSDELTTLFMNIWRNTNNLSIRTTLFTTTFVMLRKEKNIVIGQKILELLCTFVDNLTHDDDKIIYKQLSQVNNVPSFAKGKFYEKSYFFLRSLPAKKNCEGFLKLIINSSAELMEFLNPQFIENELLKGTCDTFHLQDCNVCDIIASYLLCCKDVETQQKRFDNVLYPILKQHLKSWNDEYDGKKIVKLNFDKLFSVLLERVWNTIAVDDVIIPDKLFSHISLAISTAPEVSVEINYRMITLWKLVAAIMKALNENSINKITEKTEKTHSKKMTRHRTYGYNTKIWNDYFVRCIPIFVIEWTKYLKEDIEKYDSTVFILYKDILADLFSTMFYLSDFDLMDVVKYIMLESNNCIHSYLLAIYLCPKTLRDGNQRAKFEEIQSIILAHPSSIVKMHFHEKYFHQLTCRN